MQRQQHDQAVDDHAVEQVVATVAPAGHVALAVVHRVQPPQQRDLVVRTVRPVLHQVGHQDDEEQRHPEVEPLNPAADAVVGGPTEQLVHQQVGGQQHEAHHHVVDDEVVEVGLPLGAEHRLLLAQREQLLDEDEDQRGAEQVEDEPVQPDVGRVVGEVVHRHLVAAEQGGQRHQHEGRTGQPARPAEHGVEDRDAAGDRRAQHRRHRLPGRGLRRLERHRRRPHRDTVAVQALRHRGRRRQGEQEGHRQQASEHAASGTGEDRERQANPKSRARATRARVPQR